MKQRYDVILFDADRTLFDFDQSQRLALGEVYRANGIAETEENLRTYVHLNDQLWAQFDKGEISLEELEYVRFRSFTEALGLTNLDANQLNGQYIEALGRNSILLPYKNQPLLMMLLNLIPMVLGYLLKVVMFRFRGFGNDYAKGFHEAWVALPKLNKPKFHWKNLPNYIWVECSLIVGLFRYLIYRIQRALKVT